MQRSFVVELATKHLMPYRMLKRRTPPDGMSLPLEAGVRLA
jgi:hypothetical protein